MKATHQDYRDTFSSPHGQRVLEDLCRAHFIEGPTVTWPVDPYALVYNEGQRNVVLRITAILEAEETDYGRDNRSNTGPEFNTRVTDADVNRAADSLFNVPG